VAVRETTTAGPAGEDTGRGAAGLAGPAGLILEYRFEEPISLIDTPSVGHIERWTVRVRVDRPDGADHGRDIGSARLIALNLEAGVTLDDLADPESGDWIEITRKPRRAEPPNAGTRDGAESAETSVLVLERLWIEPDYRGYGLGPIVAACAILRLGRGCRLVACYPAPFDAVQTSEARERSIEALGRIWAKVGFTPWNDGVWMLDLHATNLRDALDRLVRDARRRLQ
jgi:hypothetical protein